MWKIKRSSDFKSMKVLQSKYPQRFGVACLMVAPFISLASAFWYAANILEKSPETGTTQTTSDSVKLDPSLSSASRAEIFGPGELSPLTGGDANSDAVSVMVMDHSYYRARLTYWMTGPSHL